MKSILFALPVMAHLLLTPLAWGSNAFTEIDMIHMDFPAIDSYSKRDKIEVRELTAHERKAAAVEGKMADLDVDARAYVRNIEATLKDQAWILKDLVNPMMAEKEVKAAELLERNQELERVAQLVMFGLDKGGVKSKAVDLCAMKRMKLGQKLFELEVSNLKNRQGLGEAPTYKGPGCGLELFSQANHRFGKREDGDCKLSPSEESPSAKARRLEFQAKYPNLYQSYKASSDARIKTYLQRRERLIELNKELGKGVDALKLAVAGMEKRTLELDGQAALSTVGSKFCQTEELEAEIRKISKLNNQQIRMIANMARKEQMKALDLDPRSAKASKQAPTAAPVNY